MTFASDPATVLPSLALLSHRVRVLPMDAASLVKMPENTILFLDARDDLATAKTLCRLIHASGLSTPIVLVLTEGGFTVVNGENAAMVGLMPNDAERIFSAGADVITLGNHTFGKMQITDYLDDCPYILRPHNLGARVPGRGYGVFDCGRARIAVMNLIGRCDLAFHADNPFKTADELLKSGEKPTFTLLDFHAEATSEKLAMAYYLDGRVSAIWGTHTHVPTADEEVFPKGTGYLTDLGMTGAVCSVLGYREPEKSAGKMQGAIFTLDDATGLCVGVERVDVR